MKNVIISIKGLQGTDEEGNEIVLEFVDALEYNGQIYQAFFPAETEGEDEDDPDNGLVILKVIHEDGEDLFSTLDSDEELDACVKFMDYYYSDDSVDQYGEYYNLPLPKQGKKAPADQVNVDGMLETSNTNGTFTITDQAFPTEVADVLFNAQDAVANDEMTPDEAASNIQKAIEEYQAK